MTSAAGLGAVLLTGAPALAVLIIGKLIYGIGIAFALHAAPAYLAEMGHPSIRGLLIGCRLSDTQTVRYYLYL
jgi:MFS family permease